VGNITAGTLDLNDITTPTALETNISIASPKVHDFTAVPIQLNTQGYIVFRVTADDTEVPVVPFQRDFTVYWYWKLYAGTDVINYNSGNPMPEATIEALADFSQLEPDFARTYALSAGGYKYICWPTSMGIATSFKDQATGLDVAMDAPYTVNITNAQAVAQDYYVYKTTNILGSAINIIVT